MNAVLFRQGVKSNWKIFLIFAAIMLMYLSIIISMYDPDSQAAMKDMLEMLPKELISAMGFSIGDTTLTGFMAGYYYGFIILLFPMIFIIMLSNKLIAKHVDRGSMAYLLSTPHTRVKIITTQAVFMLFSILLLLLVVALSGIGFAESMFPGALDTGKYVLMNVSACALFAAISGICFFCSCLFNDAKTALTFGAGIPVLFFVINMLGNVGDKFSWLKYLTLFTLFDANKVVAGDSFVVPSILILAAVGIAAYIGGILVFDKKDLPL